MYKENIQSYINDKPHEKLVREALVQLLTSVNTDADYIGNFFHKKCHEQWNPLFKIDHECNEFNQPIMTLNEAVDKMGFW